MTDLAKSRNRPSHLKALLRKNWILWKRSWILSLIEILVPVLFALILVGFRGASPPEDIAQVTYYDSSNPRTFDGALTASDLTFMKSCTGDGGGVVALAPTGDSIVSELQTLLQNVGYTVRTFDSNDAIDTYTARTDYTLNDDNLCFAVVIDKNDVDNQYKYYMRFNISSYNDDPNVPDTSDPLLKPISTEDMDSFNEYTGSGVLVLQNIIDNIILRTKTSDSAANIKYQITSRTVQAYTDDQLATNLKGQTRLFLDLPLLLIFLRFVNGIMREKEKKIREGMKIMGLRNSAFYSSWFITYFIIFTVTSFVVSIVLAGGLFKHSNFGLVFLWHWEFCMCFMFFGFLLTVFFSKAKTANVAGFVIALVLGFIQSAIDENSSSTQQALASLAPQTSMGLSADFILSLEAAGVGLKSRTVNLEVLGYRMTYHYLIMLLDCAIFFLLGAYLDQVFPSEFGIRKHPLFCLMRRKKSLKRQNSKVNVEPADESRVALNAQNAQNFEEVDPNMKVEDESNQSVMVQNLKKVYGNGKLAVDDVSFNMYKGQIFALLGHNGAGKTTTISMITGMYESTSGTTSIFGMDIQEDLEEIRKVMGICPQHDILFDNLTVKEHLEMFAVFKGMDSKDIPKEVEKTILDIGLAEKRDYPSKNLSGGQKRKLSIGIAFIGGSKFILLDEPSSGMDTSARRKLWDMLKNNKNDRVILLTTHFMDEADYLGDRIGIMAEGQLKCMGRPLFLKNKFGVGYNLNLVKEDINDPSQPIKDIVHSHIPESKLLSDVSAEVAFQLPLTSVTKFQGLFDDLDKNLKKLKLSTYGVSVTTLEEVFLNVAKINAPEKHFQKEDEGNKKNDDEDLDSFNLQNQRIKDPIRVFCLHFWALVIKRVQYFKRDKRGLVCELVVPVLMIIIGILIAKSLLNSDIKPIAFDDGMYGYKLQVDYNSNGPANTAFLDNFNADDFNLKGYSISSLGDFNTQVFNDQGKDVISDPVNVFSFYVQSFDTTAKTFEYVSFIDTRAKDASVFSANKINNAFLRTATGNSDLTITVVNLPFQKTPGDKKIDNVIRGAIYSFVFAIGMSFIPASIITYIVKEREANAKHQQIVSGVSIAAYWFSNFFVDMMKYLIPGILNPLMAMAFNTTALIDGDKLGGLWAIFLLYGFCVIPFVYLSGFLFRDYGTAQIACFFFNFGTGFIGGLAVGILRLFESTRNVASILQWILRPLPTFAMTYGFLDIGNREVYSLIKGVPSIPIFDIELVGGDVLYLVIFGFVYMGLVFLVEYLKNVQSLAGMFSGEKSVPYVPTEMDEDVKKEMLEVENADDKTYSIKVDKLRKVYKLGGGKHKVAVDQISFGVKNGECFALLGTNGAGKTTTFKILSGDYIQTSGKAQISGYNLPKELSDARYEIGYCPQFDSLLENLTAREHLELYAKIKGIPENLRARFVEKQLREMNLKQYENVLAGTYSGGNKRKLSVAIAMIGNPTVVFLDEPSTGMDPEARRFMWNVISRISTERKLSSIILTTHSMEEAEALATKMGIMVNGGLKCLGTTQHIKNKFGGGYEIEIKTHLPPREELLDTIKLLKLTPEQTLSENEIDRIIDSFKAPHLKKEISEHGTGSALYNQLKLGKPTAKSVVEWILIELIGEKIKATLIDNFGPVTIIEHFQTFFRFKVVNKITIGNFFGLLEEKKDSLNIQQYSVRQSTIEQIFNTFAEEEYSNVLGAHTIPIKAEVKEN